MGSVSARSGLGAKTPNMTSDRQLQIVYFAYVRECIEFHALQAHRSSPQAPKRNTMDLFGKRLTIALLGAVMLLAAGNVQASPRPTQPPGRYRLSLMDETPNFPFDPNTVAPCTWWWDNDGSISCQNMPSEWGISLADFLRWVSALRGFDLDISC